MVTLERGHRDIFIDRCIVRRLHSLRCRENQLGNSSHGCYQNILVLPLCCCTVSDKIYLRESYHATREMALRYTASAARAELSALSAPRSGVSLCRARCALRRSSCWNCLDSYVSRTCHQQPHAPSLPDCCCCSSGQRC